MRIVFEAALAAAAIICGGMWFVTNVTETALVFYMDGRQRLSHPDNGRVSALCQERRQQEVWPAMRRE